MKVHWPIRNVFICNHNTLLSNYHLSFNFWHYQLNDQYFTIFQHINIKVLSGIRFLEHLPKTVIFSLIKQSLQMNNCISINFWQCNHLIYDNRILTTFLNPINNEIRSICKFNVAQNLYNYPQQSIRFNWWIWRIWFLNDHLFAAENIIIFYNN